MDNIVTSILTTLTDGDSKRVLKTLLFVIVIVLIAIPAYNHMVHYDMISKKADILLKLNRIDTNSIQDVRLTKLYNDIVIELKHDDMGANLISKISFTNLPAFLASFWFLFLIYVVAIINAKFKNRAEKIYGILFSFILIVIMAMLGMFIPYFGTISFIIMPII